MDFCFACDRFADCDPGLPPELAARWRASNRRLAEMGLSAYAAWLDTIQRY